MPLTRRALLRRSAAGLAVLYAGDAAAAPLPPNRLRALRGAVRGRVFAPGDRGYDAARAVYNKRYDGIRPPAVVQVADPADVVAVVKWANRYDVPLVARSGGHAYNGGSTGNTPVVVDLGRLDGVRLSSGGIATIGPGAPLIERRRRARPARRRHPARARARTSALGGLAARRRHGARRPRLGPDARQRRRVPTS